MPRVIALLSLIVAAGCATLGQFAALVRPPRFEEAPERPAEVRLLSASESIGLGGAGVRMWTKVTNPNPFGFTLSTLRGTLFLEETRAAAADFPLGLPLGGGGEAVVPIDFTVQFSDVPQLAGVLRRLITGQSVGYHVDGTIGVDAGSLGTPVFGPMTILKGNARPPSGLFGVRLPDRSSVAARAAVCDCLTTARRSG